MISAVKKSALGKAAPALAGHWRSRMKCNQPNCKGVDHQGQCWKCPHSADVAAGVFGKTRWEDTPCFRCRKANPERDCDSREQGHGRVISYEEAPPILVAAFPGSEDDAEGWELRIAADLLWRLMRLEPKLYVTLIESVRYADDGGQRTLNHVKRITNELFHEDISFQAVSVRLKAAVRKLRG